MKTLITFLFTVAAVYGFIGVAEADLLPNIITYIKTNMSMGAGQIPWPAFMILLATGIVGLLGIRRRGNKS